MPILLIGFARSPALKISCLETGLMNASIGPLILALRLATVVKVVYILLAKFETISCIVVVVATILGSR